MGADFCQIMGHLEGQSEVMQVVGVHMVLEAVYLPQAVLQVASGGTCCHQRGNCVGQCDLWWGP